MPRKLDEKGEPRNDLFAFQLKNGEDNSKLKPNSVVELVPGDTLHYLKPWHADDTDLTVQLHTEINKKHILYGKPVKSIARRQDNDDVLFAVFDSEFKYARVHLTWSQSKLSDVSYHATKMYKDWEYVYQNLFIPDNKDWD